LARRGLLAIRRAAHGAHWALLRAEHGVVWVTLRVAHGIMWAVLRTAHAIAWAILRAAHEIALEVSRYWVRATITFCVGALVLVMIRIPEVEQSFIGEPDREMLDTAFKLRGDVFVGAGDPILLMDIDNATIREDVEHPVLPGREPSSQASRGLVADLLQYILAAPPDRRPQAVMMDVDLAAPAPGDAPGAARLHKALEAWASSPTAPTLIISRESFDPEVVGLEGKIPALPASDYDDVIDQAPNIYYGEVRVLANMEGVVTEMMPYQCVQHHGRVEPLYASALLAYATLQGGKIPPGSPAQHWLEEAGPHCKTHPDEPHKHGELINFHLTLERHGEEQAWPDLRPDWPGFKTCGANGDRSVFRQLSASAIQSAGPDASHDILCRRLVIIGGTNDVAADFQQTPVHDMAGAMVLANSVRGLQLSKGGLRQAALPIQMAVLLVISIVITTGFTISRLARRRYRRHRTNAKHWRHKLALLPLNPILLNWTIAFGAHWVGVGLLIMSLDLGYWGFLSGPAFGAAMVEAIQDFTDEPD